VKSPKQIKAFIPRTCNQAFYDWSGRAAKNPEGAAGVMAEFISPEPRPDQWGTYGFVAPLEEGRYVHDLDGKARLLMVQFNERKLPASVRDEAVKKRYDELSNEQGRKLTKKEFAELKEDVEASLLPKAFVTRSRVPVLVFKGRLLICTSSAKKAESILILMMRFAEVRGMKWDVGHFEGKVSMNYLLGNIVLNGTEGMLDAGQAVKFKGEDKRVVQVKDRDIMSSEVQKVAELGTYSVIELALTARDADSADPMATFVVTDKLIFKGIKLTDATLVGVGHDAADLHATYWLLAKVCEDILREVESQLSEGEAGDDEEL